VRTALRFGHFLQADSPAWVLCFSAPPRDAAKPTLAQLNLHNTRVRRNPSGFLQVAVSNARQTELSTSFFR
jgi:hypothetical protein